MIFSRVLPFNANSLLERKGDLRSRKIARFGLVIALFIVINTAFQEISSASPNYKPTHYKQYIMMTLNNMDQTYCLIDLYNKESNFNPLARNGSHYGIPQGRSTYLKNASGTKQIQWGVRYIGNRYGWVDEANQVPDACAAWHHFLMKGWH
jgi:hypothetical protein